MARAHDDDDAPAGRVRLDKWLWAARFFKTRSLATEAVNGGKVDVNGDRAKPAKAIGVGDRVRLRQVPYEYHLEVRALGDRRGPASAAQALYEETPESRAARERVAEQHRLAHTAFDFEHGRPNKRDRRDIDRARGRR